MRIGDALRLVGGGSGGTFNGNCITADISPSFVVVSTNGTTLTVNWGDGTVTEDFSMTGSDVIVSRNYGLAGTRGITFSGNAIIPMTKFNCHYNNLTYLYVGNFVGLTHLLCHNNPNLKSVDLNSNSNLIYFIGSYNSFTNIDISNTSTNFSRIDCYYNKITSDSINSILARIVSIGTINGLAFIQNQTPTAPPTGQGITDKATLQSRGWTVITD